MIHSILLCRLPQSFRIDCRIVAGPGSGKTRVLTARVEHLIRQQGCKPWQLVVITFSNKAARELQERLESLLGPSTANQVISGEEGVHLTLLLQEQFILSLLFLLPF